MTKAMRISQTGGPEVLSWEDIELDDPGAGMIQVRHSAVGLNYIDIYHRSGLFPIELPAIFGIEAAGTVEKVGPDVTDFEVGQRVAYGVAPPGAYAEARNVPAARVIALPDDIDDQTAAAMMLKGITSEYLLRRCHAVEPGQTVLIHAAAGGVGLIMCQWAKHLGATVIGTVSSDEKAESAQAHGCDHAIIYTREKFTERVLDITSGEGVNVVYDSVGKDTLDGSIDCLARLGTVVNFGYASGFPEPLDTGKLMAKGLFFTRPTVVAYTTTRDELVGSANVLFDVVRSGAVKINVNRTYPLAEAAQAHRDLESRKTTGSSVLLT